MRIFRRKSQISSASISTKVQNNLRRARIETSGSVHAGRTAEKRTNWVDSLHEKRSFLNSHPASNSGYSKISQTVAKKRLSVAKKLIIARKIRKGTPTISKLIQKKAGWKARPKDYFLKRLNKREVEKNRVGQKPNN